MKHPTRLAFLGFALASIAAAPASADTTVPQPLARYGELPVGAPTTLPVGPPPRAVPRGSSIPGFFFTKNAFAGVPSVVQLTGVEGVDPSEGTRPDQTSTCFVDLDAERLARRRLSPTDVTPQDWLVERGFRSEVNLYKRSKEFPRGGVTAVHAERFEEKDAKPTLEMIDAWVDPATKGVRAFARKSVPLALVAASAYGLRVFAFRSDVDGGQRKLLQFVLVPDAKVRSEGTSSLIGIASDEPGTGHGLTSSQCGHLRVALTVTDDGASGELFAGVPFGEPTARPDTVTSASPPVRGRRRGRSAQRDPDARFRPLATHVSVSRTSRDPEPLVSVSFGWAAREGSEQPL